MEWIIEMKKELSFSSMEVKGAKVGEDLFLLVQGGEKPHIGCTVQAIPRLSLTGDGSVSCTSSVLNVTGHKDEMICRKLAEDVCKAAQAVVVCTGGFHIDGIKKEQIEEVVAAMKGIIEELKNNIGLKCDSAL